RLQAQSRNTYDYIFSKFPTNVGEELFVVERATGNVLGHSDHDDMEQDFSEECYQLDQLLECTEGAFKTGADGQKMYIVSRVYDDVLICAALPKDILFQELMKNTIQMLIYLLFIEAVVILLMHCLVKWKVIDGIHSILESLSAITEGNLYTTVTVGGNHEFKELSSGINAMVKSIINLSDRISAIIDISGIPLAAYEYENGKDCAFVTSGIGKLLEIPAKEVNELCKNINAFDRYINDITKEPVEGEEDVYRISDTKYVRIHMSESQAGKLGVIMDVTSDMTEKMRMRYENTHDTLTKLYKYKYFQQLAQNILRNMPSGKICAVVMLDLDYFKEINDTFGHDIGDKYLQCFAEILGTMPSEHYLTSRRSGDEFCMMIFDCDSRTDIVHYMEHFYSVLSEKQITLSDTKTRTLSASAGFAWTADLTADISVLLNHADEALYKIKKTTKGTYGEFRQEGNGT
ncbi:MAG: sensor domain-containing diguanylate cyclase, partial [Butyrivibrio sp.]|nr:sensor domain-containing diguanylate cyclase [Butyrivibrio sp.]